MALKQGAVFVLKQFFAVMFTLIGDVVLHGIEIRFGNSEGAVSHLPGETRELPALGFEPFGGEFFDVFDSFAHGNCPAEIEEDVHVIFDRIDSCDRAAEVFEDLGHVAMEGVAK